MKKYKRNKGPYELVAACAKAGITMDTEKHDAGSDWIALSGEFDGRELELITSTLNGRFIVKVDGKLITERDDHLDSEGWYQAILDLLYIPHDDEKETTA